MRIVSVTGTNGKPVVTQLLAQGLRLARSALRLDRTLGSGFYGNLISSQFTTPDPLAVQSHVS